MFILLFYFSVFSLSFIPSIFSIYLSMSLFSFFFPLLLSLSPFFSNYLSSFSFFLFLFAFFFYFYFFLLVSMNFFLKEKNAPNQLFTNKKKFFKEKKLQRIIRYLNYAKDVFSVTITSPFN